jgi:hypothetical protein
MPTYEVVLLRTIEERAVVEVTAPSYNAIQENMPDPRLIEWKPTDTVASGPEIVRVDTISEAP